MLEWSTSIIGTIMQNRPSPFIKANQLIKYIFTTTQFNNEKITISSAFYGGITAFLKEIASKIDLNTPITIENGTLSTIVNGGILTSDVSEIFGNNSWSLVNPKCYLTMLSQIRGYERVAIIKNGLDTIVYNFDDEEIHEMAIINNRFKISIPKIISHDLSSIKSSTAISKSTLKYLTTEETSKMLEKTFKDISTGKKFTETELTKVKSKIKKIDYYLLAIDKNSYEIISISTISSNKCVNKKIFNPDTSKTTISYKVRDLFPIDSWDTTTINVYEKDSQIYIQSISENMSDITYSIKALPVNIGQSNLVPNTMLNSITLNTFKFTVHTKDEGFKEKLFNFIDSLKLHKVLNNEKIKMYSYALDKSKDIEALVVYENDKYILDIKDKGNPFFTLKITQKYNYTFSFDGLSELIDFDIASNISGEEADIAYANNILYSDKELIHERISILKQCLDFMKNNGLYPNSKIKSIGFCNNFKEVDKYNKYRLIKFNTDKKNGIYSSYDMEQSNDLYTSKINYYKAYIKYPQDIVDNFKQLTPEQVIKKLKVIIGNKFKNCEEIIVQKDSTDRYSVKVSVNCSKRFDKPIEITERNHLVFKLDIDNKSDFYKISHTSRYSISHNLYRTKKILTDLQASKIGDKEVESIKAEFILLEDYEQKIEEYRESLQDLNSEKIGSAKYNKLVKRVERLEAEIAYFLKISNQKWKKYYSDYKEYSDDKVLMTNIDNYIDDILYMARKEMPTLSFKAKNALINESTKISVNTPLYEDKKYFVKNIHEKQVAKEAFKLAVKEQLTYNFQVNRWDTTHKDILHKYSNDKKHYFTLADDLEDIVKQIMNFTSKYTLLEISDDVLLERVDDTSAKNFKTKKKFQDMVVNNSSTKKLMSIDEDNLNDYLHQLLFG